MLRAGSLIRIATDLEIRGQYDLADRLRRLASALNPDYAKGSWMDPEGETYPSIRNGNRNTMTGSEGTGTSSSSSATVIRWRAGPSRAAGTPSTTPSSDRDG